MERTEVMGSVRPDGVVRTVGGNGTAWKCGAGHSEVYAGYAGYLPEEVRGPGYFICDVPHCPLEKMYPVPTEAVQSEAREMILPVDSKERKELPITAGFIDYFPLAIAAVAKHSKMGNDKHNPGQHLHWSRGKSDDHAECMMRHWVDRDAIDPDFDDPHYVGALWRLLAYVQVAEEKRLGKGPSRGSQ